MALRPGAPDLFQQLVDAARSRPPVPREDRAKAGAAAAIAAANAATAAAKEKKVRGGEEREIRTVNGCCRYCVLLTFPGR